MVFEILQTHARVIRGLIEQADLQELSTEPPVFWSTRTNYDFSSFALETFRNCQEQNREKAQHVYPWDGRDLPGGSLHRNPLASNADQRGRSWAFTYHTRASETFGADARSTPGRRDDCYLHSGWNVFVANTQVQLADLPSQIAKSLAQGGERKIYLKADARAKYGDVKAVIECIKAAGIENIGLISN